MTTTEHIIPAALPDADSGNDPLALAYWHVLGLVLQLSQAINEQPVRLGYLSEMLERCRNDLAVLDQEMRDAHTK